MGDSKRTKERETATDVASAEERATREPDLESPPHRGRRARILRVVAVLLVVRLIIFPPGVWHPDSREQRIRNLRNLGEAYMVAQQYCKALRVYAELLPLVPEDPEAANGLEKAKAKLYDEALAHLEANDQEQALEDFGCILEYDPNHRGIPSLIQTLERRQMVEKEEARCRGLLESGACREAVDCFEKLRATYVVTLSDTLHEAYLCLGQQLVERADDELQPSLTTEPTEPGWAVSQSVLDNVSGAGRAFGKTLKEKPDDEEAKRNEAQANSLKQGLEHYGISAWAECIPPLMEVYSQDAGYLSGKVAALICDAHLRLGNVHYRNGDYQAALKEYQAILEIQGCDPQPARTRAWVSGLHLTPSPTPVPTPTATPTFTATPTATPAPTKTPTQKEAFPLSRLSLGQL